MAMMPVSEALVRLMDGADPLGAEHVPLAGAHGRVLAEDIAARRTQPPFAASAMDGYAVRAADLTKPPVELTVIGSVAAGGVFDEAVEPGRAVRIFTGAPVPDGADAILIQENAEAVGSDRVRATAAVKPGEYVRPAGLDFGEGDTLLKAGRLLDAGALSLAASGDHPDLAVFRRPRVGVLATGDELVPPGIPTRPGQIIASNSVGVCAIAREVGADAIDLGIARDTRTDLEAKLDAALAAPCDVLITLGGASVGDHDLVRPTFEARGMTLDFYRIAMRPGKPMMFGRLGDMRLLGLPGNPVSSLVCSHLFAVPLIEALGGRPSSQRQRTASLGEALPQNGPREHYMRARLDLDHEGDLVATAFENQDSSVLRNFARADALIIRAPNAPPAPQGSPVEIVLLRTI